MFSETETAMYSRTSTGDRLGAEFGVKAKNRHPGLESGRLNVCDQSRLKARAEPVFDRGEIAGMAIRGDHHLAPHLVQGVKRVKKLLEDLFLAFKELDVVEEQDISRAVLGLEVIDALVTNPIDEVIEECFRSHITNGFRRVKIPHVVANRMEKMGLAESCSSEDKKWVVGEAGLIGYCHCCAVGKGVGVTHDEVLESIPFVKHGRFVLGPDLGLDRFDWSLERLIQADEVQHAVGAEDLGMKRFD